MTEYDVFKYLVENIHSTVMATVDSDCLPITCAIDIMDYDDSGLYFLTAKGKNLYKRLKDKNFVALTGMKGEDTLSCVSVSIRGDIKEIGSERLDELFEKNTYMKEIYPDKQSMSALTVFKIYRGSGEWFDLSVKPIERFSFTFGGGKNREFGYFVKNNCTGCEKCIAKCPQKCIDQINGMVYINQQNCLHCGNCYNVCPVSAVERR